MNYLQNKINDYNHGASLSSQALAMANIALLKNGGIPSALPDLGKQGVEITVPGTSKKARLLPAVLNVNGPSQSGEEPFVLVGHTAWAGVIWPVEQAMSKFSGRLPGNSAEFKIAMESVKSLAAMQAPNGGIYLFSQEAADAGKAPERDISNAHTLAAHKAIRLFLKTVDGSDSLDAETRLMLQNVNLRIELYFKTTAYSGTRGFINAGGRYKSKSEEFIQTEKYAFDVQSDMIEEFGPMVLDKWWGEGRAYTLWTVSRETSGVFDSAGKLVGLGLVEGHDNIHAESTFGALRALDSLLSYYDQPTRLKLLTDNTSLLLSLPSLVVFDQGEPVSVRQSTSLKDTWWGGKLGTGPDIEATAAGINHSFFSHRLDRGQRQ